MTRATKPTALLGAAVLATIASLLTVVTPASAQQSLPNGLAWFEDHWIDLSTDWDDATACDVSATAAVCFRTEAELDRYLEAADTTEAAAAGDAGAAVSADAVLSTTSSCSSSLRLYDGGSYTGLTLNLSTQGATINLSGYGFDNKTSSYKVGACESTFYSSANGGGLVYTGDTSALAQAASMLFGWDNVVSSVSIS